MGVLPMNATVHRAITRPRISGEAASCRAVLPAERNQMLAAPTAMSEIAATSMVGQREVMSMVAPKVAYAITIVGMPLECRPALTSPPAMAPTPKAAVTRPRLPAPPLKVVKAKAGSTTWNS